MDERNAAGSKARNLMSGGVGVFTSLTAPLLPRPLLRRGLLVALGLLAVLLALGLADGVSAQANYYWTSLECPQTAVFEGDSFTANILSETNYTPAYWSGAFVYTDAGSAGESDYVAMNKQLVINRSSFTGTRRDAFTVSTRQDSAVEGAETFTVRITRFADRSTVVHSSCVITIVDDESLPSVSLSSSHNLTRNDWAWGVWSDGTNFWVSDQNLDAVRSYSSDLSRRGNVGFDLSGHSNATGIWSDGTTMYVVDITENKVFAYDQARSRGASPVRLSGKDIALTGEHLGATGIWVNADTRVMYVADWDDDVIYAYNIDTKAHLADETFGVGFSGNNNPEGIWSDGRTMWVADLHDDRMYAYDLATKEHDSSRTFELNSANGDPRGVWSDGSSMWVVNERDGYSGVALFRYDVSALTSYEGVRHAGARPGGLWSDGTTTWISDARLNRILAYSDATNRRDPGKDFGSLASSNENVHGIWSDGSTMWALDYSDLRVYAYSMASKARDGSKEFLLHGDNRDPTDLWSDGTTLWVADGADRKAYAYRLSGGARQQSKDIGFHSSITLFGIWSDGRLMWVSDSNKDRLWAYTLDGVRQSSWDIALDAGNGNPRGIFSDGETMRVPEHDSNTVYEYALGYGPPAELLSYHNQVSGIWTQGEVAYVSNWGYDTVFAYHRDTGARLSSRDISALGAAGNNDPHGIWSDGTTMWVADWNDPQLYAYNLASRVRDSGNDIELHADNRRPLDIWGDGTTVWVSDSEDRKLYAYTLSTKARDPGKDVNVATDFGVWSNGNALWVAEGSSGYLRAYSLAGERQPGLDILLDADNGAPRGIWSDGEVMHVLQSNAAKIFSYRMPLGISLSLGSSSIAEEGGRQTVSAVVEMAGASTATSDVAVSLSLAHVTTNDSDFTSQSLPGATIRAGASSATASLAFTPNDDALREGAETFVIIATGTHPETGETLASRATLTLTDDDSGQTGNVPVPEPQPQVSPHSAPPSGVVISPSGLVSWPQGNPQAFNYFYRIRYAGPADDPPTAADAGATSFIRESSLCDDSGRCRWQLPGFDPTRHYHVQVGDRIEGGHWVSASYSPPQTSGVVENKSRIDPQNVRWAATWDSVTIHWEPPAAGEYSGFRVTGTAVRTNADGVEVVQLWGHPRPSADLGKDARTFTYEGLTPGQRYRFRVWTLRDGKPASGVEFFFTTVQPPPPPETPPWIVTVAPVPDSTTALDVSWEALEDTYYREVYWKAEGQRYRIGNSDTAQEDSYRIEGLKPDTLYTVEVTVRFGNYESVTVEGSARTNAPPPEEPPDEPEQPDEPDEPEPPGVTGLTVATVAGSAALDVSWDRMEGVPGYLVQWKSGEQEYAVPERSFPISASHDPRESYRIEGLESARAYTVKVTPRLRDGSFGESAEAVGRTATTALTVHPVAGSSTELDVFWPPVDGAREYELHWAPVGQNFNQTDRADRLRTTSHRIEGLSPDTNYRVAVTAIGPGLGDGLGFTRTEATGRTNAASGAGGGDDTEDQVLVSNLGEGNTRTIGMEYSDYAQAFTTGSNAAGYTLTSIELGIEWDNANEQPPTFTVHVYDSRSGQPGSSLAALTAPQTIVYGFNEFTHAGLDLAASTTYFVVVDVVSRTPALTEPVIRVTLSDGEDGAPGWSIRHRIISRTNTSTGSFDTTNSGHSLRMGLKGVIKASGAPPTGGQARPGAVVSAALTGLTVDSVSGEPTQLAVSWNTVDGAARYSVRWKTGSGGYGSPVATTANSYTITGLSPGTTYTVSVAAIDAGNTLLAESVGSGTTEPRTGGASTPPPNSPSDPQDSAPAVVFVIYHDPDAGAAVVNRYNQAVKLLTDAGIAYTEVVGDVQDDVDRLAGVTGSVIPRFFLGDPTEDGWTSQPKVNNGGLRWLKAKVSELTE